jgi:hypothetical protein
MSDWLYQQAVRSAADRAAGAHLSYLSLPVEVPVPPLEEIVRDLLRTDPLPCRGLQQHGGREIAFDWSFGVDDVPVIVAQAEVYVRLALGGSG